MGDLERFVVGRGGVDAPIRIYADEERIKALLKQWNEDTQRHQRAFATISSYVPEFKDAYAEALSHLRKLQNDDSVYLAAIERLKAAISTELDRDTPQALEAVVKEYAEKYPRLGGLDGVRGDLRQYLEVEKEIRARRLGRLVALLAKVRFATPPFEAKFRALASERPVSARGSRPGVPDRLQGLAARRHQPGVRRSAAAGHRVLGGRDRERARAQEGDSGTVRRAADRTRRAGVRRAPAGILRLARCRRGRLLRSGDRGGRRSLQGSGSGAGGGIA